MIMTNRGRTKFSQYWLPCCSRKNRTSLLLRIYHAHQFPGCVRYIPIMWSKNDFSVVFSKIDSGPKKFGYKYVCANKKNELFMLSLFKFLFYKYCALEKKFIHELMKPPVKSSCCSSIVWTSSWWSVTNSHHFFPGTPARLFKHLLLVAIPALHPMGTRLVGSVRRTRITPTRRTGSTRDTASMLMVG